MGYLFHGTIGGRTDGPRNPIPQITDVNLDLGPELRQRVRAQNRGSLRPQVVSTHRILEYPFPHSSDREWIYLIAKKSYLTAVPTRSPVAIDWRRVNQT